MSQPELPRLTREEWEYFRDFFGGNTVLIFVHLGGQVVLYEEDAWVGHFVWGCGTAWNLDIKCLLPTHPADQGPPVCIFNVKELKQAMRVLIAHGGVRDVCVMLQTPPSQDPSGKGAFGWELISRHIRGFCYVG